MPALLAEEHTQPPVRNPGQYTKRLSLDREKLSNERVWSAVVKDEPGRPNGLYTTSSQLANGIAHENGYLLSTDDHGRAAVPEHKSRSFVSGDSDKRMTNKPRSEGTAMNGHDKAAARTIDAAADDDVQTASTNGEIDAPWQYAEVEETTSRTKESSVLKGNDFFTDAEKAAARPLESSADSVLKPAHQVHRISSPPAFQSSSTPTLAPHPSHRLQHRHTLEVPRVSTSRLSREGASSAQGDDVIIATGRAAPSTPTGRRRGSMSLVRRTTRSIHSDVLLDEVPQDDDAARWAEMIRQKRASKRRKKEEEDDERVVMGTKVDQNHVNYVTAYNMLTGIRFTVSRTNAKLPRELTDADFTAKHKFSFDVTGNELTPSAKYDFKFKDYAPWVFRRLRELFRLDPADYLMSLTSKYILSELGSPGKSGSFFYFSRDYKYIIKTIHKGEHKFLRKSLKEYYNHVRSNPNTLLSQFYGLHRVKIAYGKKIYFVVMNNLFPPHRDIHRTFDLKGSTVGRDFHEEELEKNPRATLKDLNWLRRNLHLEFGPTKKEAFIEQMEKDVKLLQRLKIMDYSLLVGIHDMERGNDEDLRNKTLKVFQPGGEKEEDPMVTNMLMRTPSKLESAKKAKEMRQILRHEKPIPLRDTASKMPDELDDYVRKDFYFYRDDGGFRATHDDNSQGEEIYYLGIIDCLTHYNWKKKAEHFFKGFVADEAQISAVAPERYGDRFVRFISGITKTREEADREMVENLHNSTTMEDPRLSYGLQHRSPHDQTERVMERAERAAEHSRERGYNEDDVPEVELSTITRPSGDRGDQAGFTLPVVEEAAENQSTSGRSGRSAEPSPIRSQRGRSEADDESFQRPPPTPPKDCPSRRPPSLTTDFSVDSSAPLTPPKDDRARPRVDKELPPPPKELPPPPPVDDVSTRRSL